MTRTNMAMKLIYFHGFGSSAASGTIRTLREKLPDFEVIAPDIHVVVGTSMGGMYAQQMFGFNRICVNPAFFMSKTSKVLKIGTFEFFKPRLDGQRKFTITEEIINHFAEMETHQFDGVTPAETERVWGMFGSDDTQVNCEDAFLQYYHNIIHFSGGHRLDHIAINEVLIPLIHLLA